MGFGNRPTGNGRMPDGYLEAGFPKPGSLERAVREERSGMSSSDVAPDPRVVVVRMRIPHQIGQEETGTEPAPFWRTSCRRPQKGVLAEDAPTDRPSMKPAALRLAVPSFVRSLPNADSTDHVRVPRSRPTRPHSKVTLCTPYSTRGRSRRL